MYKTCSKIRVKTKPSIGKPSRASGLRRIPTIHGRARVELSQRCTYPYPRNEYAYPRDTRHPAYGDSRLSNRLYLELNTAKEYTRIDQTASGTYPTHPLHGARMRTTQTYPVYKLKKNSRAVRPSTFDITHICIWYIILYYTFNRAIVTLKSRDTLNLSLRYRPCCHFVSQAKPDPQGGGGESLGYYFFKLVAPALIIIKEVAEVGSLNWFWESLLLKTGIPIRVEYNIKWTINLIFNNEL